MKTISVSKWMSAPVITATEEKSIQFAASLMKKHKVGTVVVVKKNKPVGIVSERDIVHKIVSTNKSSTISIKEIMTSPVISAKASISDVQAATLMFSKGVKKLVLLKNQRLAGIITQTDLLKILSEKWMQ